MSRHRSINISGREIGEGCPSFIIAEIGINHSGDEGLTKQMISAAATAGADAVKLQTVTPDHSYHPATESYRVFLDATLSREALIRLKQHARSLGVILFSTPGDFEALDLLLSIEVPAIKISSGLMTNHPLIERAARSGLPLIISTGMAYLDEVEKSVKVARAAGASQIAVLQCTSIYPAPSDSLNLRAISTLREKLDCLVGYSDHHDGSLAAIAAVAAGAVAIEKHFTFDETIPGKDHAISLGAKPFAEMVAAIRSVEAMLGDAKKVPHPIELRQRNGLRRRLAARRDIPAGAQIQAEDVFLMRLPTEMPGLDANYLDRIVGKRTTNKISGLCGIRAEDIEGIK